MRRGLTFSLLGHAALGVAIVVGMGRLGQELPPDTPVTVDIVMAGPDATAPAAAEQAEAAPLPERQAASPDPIPTPVEPPPKPEPPKPEPPEPEPEPERAVEEPRPAPPPEPPPVARQAEPEPLPADAAPAQLAELPVPVAVPRPSPRKEPPKPEEPAKQAARQQPDRPRPAQAEAEATRIERRPAAEPKRPTAEPRPDTFASLLKSVEKLEKRVTAPEARAGKGQAAVAGTAGGRPDGERSARASAAELASMISRQVTPCWRIPIGSQGLGGMRAELNIVMGPDGNVRSVVPLEEGRLDGDPVFRAFAESAVRAVRACSPLKLPPESYEEWRNVIFNFDPSQLTG